MSKKADIKNLIKNLKKASKNKVIPQETLSDTLTKRLVHPQFREKDMRKEAIDYGSYGAREYFGGQDE